MITLTDNVPKVQKPIAEWVRLRCIYECYPTEAMFWVQNSGAAYIGCLDGDMTVCNFGADIAELKEFIAVISPKSIFSDKATVSALAKITGEACVMARKAESVINYTCNETPSGEVYKIFSSCGLELPPYEFFAVDLCRRLNHGFADCFLIKDECAAFSVKTGDFALLQGIASLKKGSGTVALNAILQRNSGKTLLACCEEQIKEFYLKNEFKELYKTAYWVDE